MTIQDAHRGALLAIFLLVALVPVPGQAQPAQGFDMAAYYQTHAAQPPQVFLAQFPYAQYLQQVGFTEFQTLQAHRLFLYREKNVGDDFLYRLADHFAQHYPPDHAHLPHTIGIGEAFVSPQGKQFHANDYVNRRIGEIYQTIGYFLLGRVAAFLQAEIAAGRWDPDAPANRALLDRLAGHGIYVSFEESSLTKVSKKVQQGEWKYIVDRIWSTLQEKLGWGKAAPAGQPGGQAARALKLKPYQQFDPVPGTSHFGIHVFRLKRGQAFVGHAVWMRRPQVAAHYFAYRRDGQDVPARYRQWQATTGQSVALVMSGGFTNAHLQPEGLTVEDGTVVNAVIMPDRDGLVFVEPGGGLRVANLRRGSFQLPLSANEATRPLRPQERLVDYATLLNWCRGRKATVFQTQLLAHSDTLLIDPAKAPGELRERRLLALAREPGGALFHIVFDLGEPTALADAAAEIFDTLQARRLKVEAILNLDVGSHNILDIFDPQGQRLTEPHGPLDVSQATNLVVYTR